MELSGRPDPGVVLDLIEAFRRSKTMFTAVSLGVFEELARGPAAAHEIASRLACPAGTVERLLEACTGLGLLRRDGANFANTPAADTYLIRSSELSLTGYILYSNDVLISLWQHLEDAIREGSNRWNQTFGTSGPLFDSFFPTPEKMRTFIMGMHGFGVLSSPSVVRAFDLGSFRRLVDLGGATGHLTIAACECYPELNGVVFDFEKVLVVAREQIAKSPARDRIETLAGDFFTDALPEADLFAMGRILHDWPPAKIELLLGKIYDRLPSGGALLLAEKLENDDRCGPVPAQMQDLNMLICTEGQERSLAQYRALLLNAGFVAVEGLRTGKAVDAVLARKA